MHRPTKQPHNASCIRDKIICALVVDLQLNAKQICNLRLHDIAMVPNELGGFIEARPHLSIDDTTCGVTLPQHLKNMIEDYVNTSRPVCPFRDFRPDIGHHLFPSARSTSKGLSRQAIIKIIQTSVSSNIVLSLETMSNEKEDTTHELESSDPDGNGYLL